jgi:hypothetical protein
MWTEVCPYICDNKTDYGRCKTSACINPTHRTPTFTSYDPIEIARQYAPKFDKPAVDMVKVVRCKDCKYCLIHDKILFCGYLGSIGEWRYRTETDYCSRGERKEEAGNG